MASGSSGRPGFHFGSDDILCSHDDMVNPDGTIGKHSDPITGTNSVKDFRENEMGRSYSQVYNQREESVNQDLIATVERTMKKYADNLLRFLEGISSRLQQLELYCYNLEKSIGEMRSDLTRGNSEADSKLRSLEKHLQEVHRSVQILRDKQELAETQKELVKLNVQKESSTANPPTPKEDPVTRSASDAKQPDNTQEVQNKQLALALPHQPHQPMMASPPPQNIHAQSQQHPYYQQNPVPSMPPQSQAQHHPQDHYLQVPQQQALPLQPRVSQPQQAHQFPPQWSQQVPQQVLQQPQQPQQPAAQPQMAPQTAPAYPPTPQTAPSYSPYTSTQNGNPSPQPVNPSSSAFPSMPMQVPFSGTPQPGMSNTEHVGYGYAGAAASRTSVQKQPPAQNMPQQPPAPTHQSTYGAPMSDSSYPVGGPHHSQPSRQGYMMYEGGRAPHPMPPHFSQSGYPPTHVASLQNQQPSHHSSPSPVMRSHPYGELIENVVSMGYGRDFVTSVIRGMDESGQPVDFNSVLDRLNSHSSGGSQRGW